MKRIRREPIFTTDPRDGAAVVHVLLAGNHPEPAVLLRADFDRLVSAGISTQWTLTKVDGRRYVRCGCNVSGRSETIARLIIGAKPDKVVTYKDGSPLNLRRDNLAVRSGRATRDADPERIQETAAAARLAAHSADF